MRIVSVCGHFGFGKNLLNGQTVKTKIIADELCAQLGHGQVKKIDTHGGILKIIKSVLSAGAAMFNSQNLIIMPAHNGIRIFGPLLALVKSFSHCKLHYIVIGGWLPKLLADKPSLARALKKFDFIHVETTSMRRLLEGQGFGNVVLMPNCKKLEILPVKDLVYHTQTPFPLCTFSRVMEEKGIEDAIEAVKAVNGQAGSIVYTLDIYGPVDIGYQARFSQIQSNWPEFIRYCGAVPFDKSVQTLKNYAALLFPTKFYTEGIPGTIIDAYAAGVPVISSRWESFADVVEEGMTGYGYEFDNMDDLISLLQQIAQTPQMILENRKDCLKKANEFMAEQVVGDFIKYL